VPEHQELRQGRQPVEKSLGNKTKGKRRVVRSPGCPLTKQCKWRGNSGRNSFCEREKEGHSSGLLCDPAPLPCAAYLGDRGNAS